MGLFAFGNYILSTNAKDTLQDQGLNPIEPILEGNIAKVPFTIRSIITSP
jgi:hypothetical protein